MILYEDIKSAVAEVMAAEDNATAWKAEAKRRNKRVKELISAAKKVNKDIDIDTKSLIKQIRNELQDTVTTVDA